MKRFAAFGNHAGHFGQFAVSLHPTDPDSAVVADLEGEADLASELLLAAYNELGIYDALSCSADRAAVRPIVAARLKYYQDEFGKRARIVSTLAIALRHAEIANESRRMEAELLSAKERFGAISASLP